MEEFVYSFQAELENLEFLPLEDSKSCSEGMIDLVHCKHVTVQLVIDALQLWGELVGCLWPSKDDLGHCALVRFVRVCFAVLDDLFLPVKGCRNLH